MSHAGLPIGLAFYTPECKHPTNEAGWTCNHCRRLAVLSPRAPKKPRAQVLDADEEYVDTSRAEADDDALGIHRNQLATFRRNVRAGEARAPLAPPAPPPSGRIVKECRCCGAKHTHEAWLRLDILEVKETTEDGIVELHDMRNCSCGSTLLLVSEREKGTGIYYRGGGR